MADERTEKQKVQEITDKLEEGLKELFESEKYKTYPLGARLSPSRQRDGDIQTEQCAFYRGQQRDRQREARHIGVCALYQHHVGVVRKGHQQESKNRH